ncbi:hypothetical protein SAMN02745121_06432 [Nannocystis exedens]|uniref:Uncharacterized protein n=1 Tax=Nannocystis exedens TaxID=54 RepID=A0A1I2F5A5_9BACT|nr:hypothetical protein [Nannocystis exedens]PCC73106.1 hypothetical protein NAEX_06192 [Nannocystis exedens]SFF00149.1 hypothetical protein SAMN02745121_06432 [Nannocystis exedens]
MSVPARLDFATYGRPGTPGLLVEAKRVDQAKPEWAREWRQNLFEYQPQGLEDVLLALVTLARIFVWPVGAALDAPPSFVLDTMAHLQPYFDRVGLAPASISPRQFERVVSRWLEVLTNPHRVRELSPALRRELQEAGLLAALEDALLVEEGSARW